MQIRVGSISAIIGGIPAQMPVPNPAVNIAAEISPGTATAEFHKIVGGSVPAAISRPYAQNAGRRQNLSATRPNVR